MSDLAVRVESVGKRYRIGAAAGGRFKYKSLRDTLGGLARRPLDAVRSRRRLDADNSFWALDDVSFDVRRGEVVGVIGRNGAGKSTLLKILSRITKPTRGQVALRGRVGSLLEVGTGFHPELTGRENVYLNGAILGMTRGEVRSKFDEIVAFSEVERFLDTPVKQYSSGMYTRLAFAVAAHLEPEVLIVDEVLAVGDASFQKKCLGKMQDVAGEGRTVLFVSHNMASVEALCGRAVWLHRGRVMADGRSGEVVGDYLGQADAAAGQDLTRRTDRVGEGGVRLREVRVAGDPPDAGAATLPPCGPTTIDFVLDGEADDVAVAFTITDQRDHPLAHFNSNLHGPRDAVSPRASAVRWSTPMLPLVTGGYRLNVAVFAAGACQDAINDAARFEVGAAKVEGREVGPTPGLGSIALPHRWEAN